MEIRVLTKSNLSLKHYQYPVLRTDGTSRPVTPSDLSYGTATFGQIKEVLRTPRLDPHFHYFLGLCLKIKASLKFFEPCLRVAEGAFLLVDRPYSFLPKKGPHSGLLPQEKKVERFFLSTYSLSLLIDLFQSPKAEEFKTAEWEVSRPRIRVIPRHKVAYWIALEFGGPSNKGLGSGVPKKGPGSGGFIRRTIH
uniref:Uncharacterized protein n=1 Tax=Cucumis sativus TaxID=3659 RepID=A0A0A0KR88_CUCSA